MKRFVLYAVLLFVAVNYTFAQRSFESQGNYSMGIGPLIGYKIGVNAAEPPDGIKNGVGLAGLPDIGASFYVPLNPDDKMGLFIDAVYSSYGYVQKYFNSNSDWTDRFSYLAFGPNFYISGFTVGLNIGIPLSAGRYFEKDDLEISTSSLATIFELKIGGNFTLNESELGRLNLFIDGSYIINGQYSDDLNLGTHNPHPAAIQLGLSYIFNME